MADLSQFLNSGGKRYRTVDVQTQATTAGSAINVTFTPASDEFIVLSSPSYGSLYGDLTITCGGRTVVNNEEPSDLLVVGGVGEAVTLDKQVGTGNSSAKVSFGIKFYEEDQ